MIKYNYKHYDIFNKFFNDYCRDYCEPLPQSKAHTKVCSFYTI